MERGMDAEYLKEKVGPALTQGLTEVSMLQPVDPIGFLADWLVQFNTNEIRRKEVQAEKRQLELEREALRQRKEAERKAKEEEERRRIAEEREKIQAMLAERARKAGESIAAWAQQDDELEEVAKEKEEDKVQRAHRRVKEIRAALTGVAKELDDVISLEGKPAAIMTVVQGALFQLGYRPSEVDDWASCVEALNDKLFFQRILQYSPRTAQNQLRFSRVGRITRGVVVADVQRSSFFVFLLLEWLKRCADLRNLAVQARKEEKSPEEGDKDGAVVGGAGVPVKNAVLEQEEDRLDDEEEDGIFDPEDDEGSVVGKEEEEEGSPEDEEQPEEEGEGAEEEVEEDGKVEEEEEEGSDYESESD